MQSLVYIRLLLSKNISSDTQYIPSMGKMVIFVMMGMGKVMLIPQEGKQSNHLIQPIKHLQFQGAQNK